MTDPIVHVKTKQLKCSLGFLYIKRDDVLLTPDSYSSPVVLGRLASDILTVHL